MALRVLVGVWVARVENARGHLGWAIGANRDAVLAQSTSAVNTAETAATTDATCVAAVLRVHVVLDRRHTVTRRR